MLRFGVSRGAVARASSSAARTPSGAAPAWHLWRQLELRDEAERVRLARLLAQFEALAAEAKRADPAAFGARAAAAREPALLALDAARGLRRTAAYLRGALGLDDAELRRGALAGGRGTRAAGRPGAPNVLAQPVDALSAVVGFLEVGERARARAARSWFGSRAPASDARARLS